jgi:DNA-directed RNA polymerase I subunit RPA49
MRALRNDLGQTFGTKKAKKAIASLTENAISSVARSNSPTKPKLNAAATAMLEAMAATTEGMATRAELQQVADESKPRPKANLEATNIQDVYTLEDLVGLETLKNVAIKDWQDAAKSKQEVRVKCRFVATRLQRLASDPASVQKTKLLRFLLCLVDFYNVCKPMRGSRKVPPREELRAAISAPDSVVESIRRKFSNGGIMSKYECDLLITHVCALALVIENFEVDTYDLKEDLKLDQKQISQYFKEIGARIGAPGVKESQAMGWSKAEQAQHRYAKLKLPLDFPKVSFARRK